MKITFSLFAFAGISLLFTACGGSSSSDSEPESTEPQVGDLGTSISFTYTAEIISGNQNGDDPLNQTQIGETITGSFGYEFIPNSLGEGITSAGLYNQPSSISLNFSAFNDEIQDDGEAVITVENIDFDEFIYVIGGGEPNGLDSSAVRIELIDNTGTVFNSAQLPTEFDISQFDEATLSFSGQASETGELFSIDARILSIEAN